MRALKIWTRERSLMISDASMQLRYLKNIRKQKRGVIGYFSNNIPEEIILSGGFHPFRLYTLPSLFSPKKPPIRGPCCSFVRAVSKSNLHQNRIIDGIVFPNICDSLRHLRFFWKSDLKQKFIETISYPTIITKESAWFFKQELVRFTRSFESSFKVKISDSELRQTIHLCNKNRKLLRILSDSRKSSEVMVRSSELIGLCLLSTIVDKREVNNFLASLVVERSKNPIKWDGKKRLMLIGPLIDNISFIREIEKLNVAIPCEEIMSGPRYFDNQINADSEDLLTEISASYLNRMQSPAIYSVNKRINRILTLVDEYNVRGVIFINRVSCEPYSFSYVTMRDLLIDKGIPTLYLEMENNTPPCQREMMRIECFLRRI